jgi:Glyoxalase-like domain
MPHPSRAGDGGPAGRAGPAPPIGWIREVVLDSADPWALAGFWAEVLGGTPVQWYPGWVTLEPPPHGQRLSFQGTADPPPSRGAVHFDVLVGDLAAAHERVLSSGGVFLREHVSPRPGPGGEPVPWRVYTDPEGHVFCLVVR